MSIISVFAGRYFALDYAYGLASSQPNNVVGPALTVATGNSAAGVGTIVLNTGFSETTGGITSQPIALNTPITVGIGANAETVTPTAVTYSNNAGFSPGPYSVTVTATFANVHGAGEPVTSGTFGLQEAINSLNSGRGIVVVTGSWYDAGGTAAMLAAASLPTNGKATIEDLSTLPPTYYKAGPSSLTVLAAPSAATTATVASLAGVVGTWTATTIHVVFSYVTADGGETLSSADYSFTSTASLAIGGSGPAALAGAVGYRVYLGTTAWLAPVTAANGTVIQCGPIAAFKIGTPFSIATATTAALATIPLQSTAFGAANAAIVVSPSLLTNNQSVLPPFAATGVVTFGTAKELGHVQLPAGFLNQFGRTLRIKFQGNFTPVSTATLILNLNLASVFGLTSTTLFTVTSVATSGTGQSPFFGEIIMTTASTGAAGTLEVHGVINAGLATATPNILSPIGDSVFAVSSAADLTKQDVLQLTINSGTANLTTAQLRSLIIETLG